MDSTETNEIKKRTEVKRNPPFRLNLADSAEDDWAMLVAECGESGERTEVGRREGEVNEDG